MKAQLNVELRPVIKDLGSVAIGEDYLVGAGGATWLITHVKRQSEDYNSPDHNMLWVDAELVQDHNDPDFPPARPILHMSYPNDLDIVIYKQVRRSSL